MKLRKKTVRMAACVLALVLTGPLLTSLAAQTKAAPPSSGATEFKAPEHPITAEQMRAYFNVCHIPGVSRALTHEKIELERQTLPPWYPSNVWDEIETAIDNIDLPDIALPVYQKYMSQQQAAFLAKLYSTPQGQVTVKAMLDAMVRAQHAGATAAESHRMALKYISPQEDSDVTRMVNQMSAAEKRDLELHFSELKRLQPLLANIQQEYSLAVMAKQTELAKTIAAKHQAEMSAAKRSYDASH